MKGFSSSIFCLRKEWTHVLTQEKPIIVMTDNKEITRFFSGKAHPFKTSDFLRLNFSAQFYISAFPWD